MPSTGRSAVSAAMATRNPRTAPVEHPSKRSEKAKSAQSMQPPRRESAQSTAGDTAPRPGLKSRAYSAPMVPKDHFDGTEHEHHLGDALHGEPGDDGEIADDPFFQRYNFPQPGGPVDEEASGSGRASDSDTEGPMSPTHINTRAPGRAGTLPSPRSPTASTGSGHSDSAPVMQDINVVVLGARGAGKSTFIRGALSLPSAGSSATSSRKMEIDGGYFVVRFLEVSFDDICVETGNVIKLPETLDGHPMPRVDGAVILYDVTNVDSLEIVPKLLDGFGRTPVPFVLAACKCDQHPALRDARAEPGEIEPKARKMMENQGRTLSMFQTAESTPDEYRKCLACITRFVIASKRHRTSAVPAPMRLLPMYPVMTTHLARSQASVARRRANSSAVRHVAPREQWARKHERASSEFSVSRHRKRDSDVKGHRYKSSETPGHTFLDLDESPGYDSNDSDSEASDQEQSVVSEQPSNENGYTFDQLVDRLLSQPMSKNDHKFVKVFLALYRKFAAPSQLLDAILKRFEAVTREKTPFVIRIGVQQRYLNVLEEWVRYYPGDFAYTTTRKTIRKFASSLASSVHFSAAAMEITHDLEIVTEDDDTDWACSDRQRDKVEVIPTFNNVLDEDSEEDDFTRAIGSMSMTSDRFSIARSMNTTATGTSRTTQSSESSQQTLANQIEKNERLAKALVPNPIKPLSKIQWHQLMSESDEAIARELTRIDWIMFSSIRPRDLVRHVSMNAEEKKRCKSLENVNRMIDHFNHLAYLVTNYILLRDKPKHRALMLEKWMNVARALRQLNNYNSLGAVLAGIKGTAVHRLVATRDLVTQTTGRDFMRLEILMGTQKSHFAYRLAWENSSGERIPYIPLHRRDLVSASEGNSTFVGDKKTPAVFAPHPGVSVFQGAPGNRDSREAPPGGVTGKERINWRKFEIMGEVVSGVQKAQGTPYPAIAKNEEIRNLLLDVKIMKDDDDLYDRSVQLEAAGVGEKRRFVNWFRER